MDFDVSEAQVVPSSLCLSLSLSPSPLFLSLALVDMVAKSKLML